MYYEKDKRAQIVDILKEAENPINRKSDSPKNHSINFF